MASTISLFMSRAGFHARLTTESQDRGFVYDLKTRRSTTALFDVPAEGRLVLQVSLEKFHHMLDQVNTLDHYLSLVNEPERIHLLNRNRVTVALPTIPDGKLIATFLPADGRRSLFLQVQEVPYERVEEIRFITEKEQRSDVGQVSTKEQMLAMAQALAPDANFYANGMPKDRSRYPPQISQTIPASAIFQEAAADAYLAVIPSPLTATNQLVALDPPIAAAFLMSLQSETLDETIAALIATVEKYFDVYASAEKLQSPSTTFHWWKKAMKVMQAGYKALGVIIILANNRGRQEYELVKDAVYSLRNHLGIMFRRTGKEPSKPSSLETECPAWWHREHEEFKKAKPKKGDAENETEKVMTFGGIGRGGNPLRGGRPGGRGRRSWPRGIGRGVGPYGGNESADAQPTQEAKEISEEEPALKKQRGSTKPTPKHTRAVRDPVSGEWRYFQK